MKIKGDIIIEGQSGDTRFIIGFPEKFRDTMRQVMAAGQMEEWVTYWLKRAPNLPDGVELMTISPIREEDYREAADQILKNMIGGDL